MAAIKIEFDIDHNPLVPTFILGDRMGNKFGIINNVTNINISDKMNDCPEISFTVYKYDNEKECYLWDKIQNLMTVYCQEWNTWFEMGMDLSDETDVLKNISLIRLGEAELSQIYLHELQINTEDDIDYSESDKATILYNKDDKSCSLLHRILDKAPHYDIEYVDPTIAELQREFSFDKTTIRDAFNEISQEINCLFIYNTADDDGNLIRTISVYDLENYCRDCGYRGEFSGNCPKCKSNNINEGYGNDTNIYVSSDGLGNSVKLEVDKDSIKNCFRLGAGDEIITDAVKMCSPSNSLYLWNFSDDMKNLMPKELVDKIDSYYDMYNEYNNIKTYKLNKFKEYNEVLKYCSEIDSKISEEKQDFPSEVIGYANLIDKYYDAIDMGIYLTSELMPSVTIMDTSTDEQVTNLKNNLTKVAVEDLDSITTATTAKSSVLSMAKVLVDGRYLVEIGDEYSYSNHIFKCKFKVINISDEEDFKISDYISIELTDENYEDYIKNKINIILNDDAYDTSISWLFDLEKCSMDRFKEELQKYGLNSLSNFNTSCDACIDFMISQDLNKDKNSNEYKEFVKPYQDRSTEIKKAIEYRENQIKTIEAIKDDISKTLDEVHRELDMVDYMGDLYPILCSYIREDEYENPNFISDGLTNAEIIEKTKEFVAKAEKELYKASTLQHKISADIKNLLTIKEFKPLVNQFECGNWIRVRADKEVFKLRLLEYDINYDEHSLNVVFSDVSRIFDGITDLRSVIEQASSIAGSYDSFKAQMNKAANKTKYIDNWVSEGIDITNISLSSSSYNQDISWDKNGLLCRETDGLTGEYKPQQLKVIANGIYLTDDNWETSKTGIGKFTFTNPLNNNKRETRYGVCADAIVGNLILSESLGIYNDNNNIRLDKDGFIITNGKHSVIINPDEESIFTIKNQSNKSVITMTKDGNLVVVGDITATKLTLIDGAKVDGSKVSGLSNVAFSGKYTDLTDTPEHPDMSVYISKDGVVGKNPSEGATGFKVSSNGLLEASNAIIYGSTISGNIIASSGKIGGFTISGSNTASNGFWNWSLSSIVNTNASTVNELYPQYAAFMRGQSDDGTAGAKSPDNVIFGVKKRISTSTNWSDGSYMFYVKANGTIRCTDITTTGDMIIYDKLYMANTDNEKCEVMTFKKGDTNELTFGAGCEGIQFKCKNATLGQAWSIGVNDPTWQLNGQVTIGGTSYFNGLMYVEKQDAYFRKNIHVTGTSNLGNSSAKEYYLCDSSGTTKQSAIRYIEGTTGAGMSIGTGGLTIIGAGESSKTIAEEEGRQGQNEQLYLTSDINVYVATKCDTITDRKTVVFTDGGVFRPVVTEEWSVGSSTYRFKNGYFVTVYNSSGSITGSDKRIKKDFSKLPNPEEFIMSLKPMQYKYKNGDSNRYHWGFIAQDVKKSLDEVCHSDCGLYIKTTLDSSRKTELGLRYEELIAPHIYLTQRHNEKIKQLESEIKLLKEKLELKN